jgi:hypothetical protein
MGGVVNVSSLFKGGPSNFDGNLNLEFKVLGLLYLFSKIMSQDSYSKHGLPRGNQIVLFAI